MVVEIIIICATLIIALALYLFHNYYMWKVNKEYSNNEIIEKLEAHIKVLEQAQVEKQQQANEASAAEAAAFFDILKDPTKLYE